MSYPVTDQGVGFHQLNPSSLRLHTYSDQVAGIIMQCEELATVKELDLQFIHEYKEGLRVCVVSRSKPQLNGSQGNGNSS